MNRLPAHRSALTGRTFSRSWSAQDFDPIERYTRGQIAHLVDWLILALFLGTLVAIAVGVL